MLEKYDGFQRTVLYCDSIAGLSTDRKQDYISVQKKDVIQSMTAFCHKDSERFLNLHGSCTRYSRNAKTFLKKGEVQQ